jgi:hypothetical protein
MGSGWNRHSLLARGWSTNDPIVTPSSVQFGCPYRIKHAAMPLMVHSKVYRSVDITVSAAGIPECANMKDGIHGLTYRFTEALEPLTAAADAHD